MVSSLTLEQFLKDIAFYVKLPTSTNLIMKATADQRLVEDLDFDSVAFLEIQLGIEDRYNITINCQEANACRTVAELFELVNHKMSKH